MNSGTEANDIAMMLMRGYTGNWDIVCHRNSYHGAGNLVKLIICNRMQVPFHLHAIIHIFTLPNHYLNIA